MAPFATMLSNTATALSTITLVISSEPFKKDPASFSRFFFAILNEGVIDVLLRTPCTDEGLVASLLANAEPDRRTSVVFPFFRTRFPFFVGGLNYAFSLFLTGLLVAKAASAISSGVSTRVLETIVLESDQTKLLFEWAILNGPVSMGNIETVLQSRQRDLTDQELVASVISALSTHQHVAQSSISAIARVIVSRLGQATSMRAAHMMTLLEGHVEILEAVVSLNQALAESAMSYMCDNTIHHQAFAALATCLFDPNRPSEAAEAAMRATAARAAAELLRGSVDLLLTLAVANKDLLCKCLSSDTLTRFIMAGNDPVILFQALDRLDHTGSLRGCVIEAIPRQDTIISAIGASNTRAIASLVNAGCLPEQDDSCSAQATLQALQITSPFKSPDARDPGVFSSLLDLLAAIVASTPHDDKVAATARLSSTLCVMDPLLYAGTGEGADRSGETETIAMITELTRSLQIRLYDLVEDGAFIAKACTLSNFALIATMMRILATDETTVEALFNQAISSELIATRTPASLLQLIFELSDAEAQSRSAAASTSLGLVHISKLSIKPSMPDIVGLGIKATEGAIRSYITSLDALWTCIITRFLERTTSVRGMEMAWFLLNLGGNPQLAVSRVYSDPTKRHFIETAFLHPDIASSIVTAGRIDRGDLLCAWAKSIRTSEEAHRLGGMIAIDRSAVESPALALGAVMRIQTAVQDLGGYGSVTPASFVGVLGEGGVPDTATGDGAHRDILLFLLRLCIATDSFSLDHPEGTVPTRESDPVVLHLYGFLIGQMVRASMSLGEQCIAPSILAVMIGMTGVALTSAFFNAYSKGPFEECSLEMMLSNMGALTEGLPPADIEALKSAGHSTVKPESLCSFLAALNHTTLMWNNMGSKLAVLSSGFMDALSRSGEEVFISDPIMQSLRLILADPIPIAAPADDAAGIATATTATFDVTETTLHIRNLLIGYTTLYPFVLQMNTIHEGTFAKQHHVVNWFWELVGKMDQADLRTLLRFWTSQNPPPGGVHPGKYAIRSKQVMEIPTASTCIFTLIISDSYSSIQDLDSHIRIALANTDSGMHG